MDELIDTISMRQEMKQGYLGHSIIHHEQRHMYQNASQITAHDACKVSNRSYTCMGAKGHTL